MEYIIVVIGFGLFTFVLGYYFGAKGVTLIIEAHKEYEQELKKQRDDAVARYNYLVYGNSAGKFTLTGDNDGNS